MTAAPDSKVERITEERIRHIALLSRLDLSDTEVTDMSTKLTDLVAHINQLERVDVACVAPTSHALPMSNVFREDVTRPSLGNDAALANAADTEPPFFRVPQII